MIKMVILDQSKPISLYLKKKNYHEKIIGHTYICTKCNDNFKFTLISNIKRCKDFSSSPPKCLFIFYNLFSLRLTENLHEQKHFLRTWSICFVYIIFL